jgi:NAD(P) transhydrogenase subunit alpha
MIISVFKERRDAENRVSMTPTVAANLLKMGFEVWVENGAGAPAHFSDESYIAAGASIKPFNELKSADVYVQINMPTTDILSQLPDNKIWISNVYHRSNTELVEQLQAKKWSVFSQANLAGYRAVIEGAYHLDKIFPLLMTAAGTVTPAKVLIFGVGVAGLQAIATAKRLGAVVEATDVRPETKEQVQSLGGKFIEVKGVEVGSEGGYAKEATDEYRKAQREAVNKSLAQADLVITTALVPGKKAPILIDDEQLSLMKNGSIIVDMAAEQGGNCAQTKANEIYVHNGVKIIGSVNLPSSLSSNASELFARNIWELLKLIGPKGTLEFNLEDEIVQGCLISHTA